MHHTRTMICFAPLLFGNCHSDGEFDDPDKPPESAVPDSTNVKARNVEIPCAASKQNLILNGEFDLEVEECGWRTIDETNWGITVYQECGGRARDCVAYLETEVWGDPWIAALTQRAHLQNLTHYALRFAVAADAPRELTVALRAPAGAPEDTFFLQTMPVTTLWQACQFEFDGPVFASDAALTFAFGADDAGLSLDSVSLIPLAH